MFERFERSIASPFKLFVRFSVQQADLFARWVIGMPDRTRTIIARGMSEQTTVVNRMRAMQQLGKGLQQAIRKHPEVYGPLKPLVQETAEDLQILVDEVQRIEPRRLARNTMQLAKILATTGSVNAVRTVMKWHLNEWMFDKKTPAKEKAAQIRRAYLNDTPGWDALRNMMNIGKPMNYGWGKLAVKAGVLMIPGVGALDTIVPNSPISQGINQRIFPKKRPRKSKRS